MLRWFGHEVIYRKVNKTGTQCERGRLYGYRGKISLKWFNIILVSNKSNVSKESRGSGSSSHLVATLPRTRAVDI